MEDVLFLKLALNVNYSYRDFVNEMQTGMYNEHPETFANITPIVGIANTGLVYFIDIIDDEDSLVELVEDFGLQNVYYRYMQDCIAFVEEHVAYTPIVYSEVLQFPHKVMTMEDFCAEFDIAVDPEFVDACQYTIDSNN